SYRNILDLAHAVPLPPVPAVDGDGLFPGKVRDVEMRITALANSEFGLATWIRRLVYVAPFVLHHHLHSVPKPLLRAHPIASLIDVLQSAIASRPSHAAEAVR